MGKVYRLHDARVLFAKTADICGIHRNMASVWRDKVLGALQNMADPVFLNGIVEADETFFSDSYKGNNKSGTFVMPEKPVRDASHMFEECQAQTSNYPILKFEVKDKYCETLSRIIRINKETHDDYNWLIHKLNINTGLLINNFRINNKKVLKILEDSLPPYQGNNLQHGIHSNYISANEEKQIMCEVDRIMNTAIIISSIYKSEINNKVYMEVYINPQDSSFGMIVGTFGKTETIEIFIKEKYKRPVKIESYIINNKLISEELNINAELTDIDNSYKASFKFEIHDEMIDTFEKIHFRHYHMKLIYMGSR